MCLAASRLQTAAPSERDRIDAELGDAIRQMDPETIQLVSPSLTPNAPYPGNCMQAVLSAQADEQ